MTDDDRISYLIGDRPAGDLDPGERAGLDDLLDVLADPAIWAEPSPGLEDRIVAAIPVSAPSEGSDPDRPVSPPADASAPGDTTAAAGARAASRRRRRAVIGFIGLAAAVAAVIGLAVGLGSGTKRPTYHAALAGTTLAPGASGQVTLVQTVSGWQVTLHAEGLPRLDNGQYYQAWLKNKAGILVPIGTFNQPNQVTLWSGVPPTQFPVITVTRQKANGDLNSSGQRVLTGTAHVG